MIWRFAMIDRLVGNGNLPNVYISNIELRDVNKVKGSEKTIKIAITAVVKDKKINGAFQWSDNQFMTDFLLINFVQSTSQNFSDSISNGTYTILKSDYKNSQFYDETSVKRQVKKLSKYNDSKTKFIGLDTNGNEIYDFYYDFEFALKEADARNLTYFANIGVDTQDLATQYRADFSSDLLSFYQGPITSEIVFSNGMVQKTTNKFVFQNGIQYGGAVHEHNGQYMEGPFHTNRRHQILFASEINNFKIKDLRSPTDSPKKLNTQKSKRAIFGDTYTTNDEDGRVKKLFFVDYNSLFKQKTKYGDLLNQIDEDIYNEALSNFKIKKLSVYRDQVVVGENTSPMAKRKETIKLVQGSRKILNITNDITPNNLSSSYNEYSSIVEVPIGSNQIRYFNFVDESSKDIYSGNYVYTLELKLADSSIDYLKSKYLKYKNDVKSLESYYFRANKRKYYNDSKKQFNNLFVSDENSLYNLRNISSFTTVPWIISVENYIELYKFLNYTTDDESNDLKNNIFNSINPKTGNRNGILNFIQLYKNTITSFINKFQLSSMIQGSAFNISAASKPPLMKNMIEVSYQDQDYVDFSTIRTGYSLMPKPEPVPIFAGALPYESPKIKSDSPTLVQTQVPTKLSDFNHRVSDERKRFFVNRPTLNLNEKRGLSKKNIESFQNIDKKASKYLSPISMVDKKSKVDLTSASRTDSKKLNNKIKSINKRKTKNKYDRKFKKRSNKLIKKRKTSISKNGKLPQSREFRKKIKYMKPPTVKQFDLKRKLNYDASDFLGKETKINSADEKFQLQELGRKEKFRTNEKINNALIKRKVKKVRSNFDLESKNNVLNKILNDDFVDTDNKFEDIPLHVKALISSRNNSSKSDLLSAQSDVLISEETENELLISHFNIQKLEYLDGFMLDDKGEPIITAPIWKEMNTDMVMDKPTFIMRAVNYVDDSLKIDIPNEIDLPIFDSFVVIQNDIGSTNTASTTPSSILLTAYNTNANVSYDFCTSNIVKQSEKQNGFLSSNPSVAASTTQQVRDGNQIITTGVTTSGGGY